jgi:phosphoribosylformimino-5-aminoimidazole carboxamide ribotide isomerase
MILIPAIDIIDGKCVRLTQGDYEKKKIYNEHPLEVALQFEGVGIRRLHLVDLDGAKKGSVVNQKVLEQLASKTKLEIDFGGGIKTDADIRSVFDAGAAIATVGSIAVKDKELFFRWLNHYGAERLLLGADVKEEKITIGGWLEGTDISVFDFLRAYVSGGVTNVFCTDVAMDGLLQGPSIELYKKIIAAVPGISLIASGGVSCLADLDTLQECGCEGVIVGKAIYENRITMEDLRKRIITG